MPQKTLEAIDPKTLYPLEVFYRISGYGQTAIRDMRREGLRIRYSGRRGHIYGEDFIEFILEHGESIRPCDKK